MFCNAQSGSVQIRGQLDNKHNFGRGSCAVTYTHGEMRDSFDSQLTWQRVRYRTVYRFTTAQTFRSQTAHGGSSAGPGFTLDNGGRRQFKSVTRAAVEAARL